MKQVEQWGIYELVLPCDVSGLENPFLVRVAAQIQGPGKSQRVDGFYDGKFSFIIRYMPKEPGEHLVRVYSDILELDGKQERFLVTPATEGNHGPAVVSGTRFRYADGSPLFICGTTAYVWHHRPAEIREQSLDSFSKYGFNKIRMLFFPKHYTGGYSAVNVSYEPPCYPFEGQPGAFDFYRPNPEYFDEFESRLRELMNRDISRMSSSSIPMTLVTGPLILEWMRMPHSSISSMPSRVLRLSAMCGGV